MRLCSSQAAARRAAEEAAEREAAEREAAAHAAAAAKAAQAAAWNSGSEDEFPDSDDDVREDDRARVSCVSHRESLGGALAGQVRPNCKIARQVATSPGVTSQAFLELLEDDAVDSGERDELAAKVGWLAIGLLFEFCALSGLCEIIAYAALDARFASDCKMRRSISVSCARSISDFRLSHSIR